MLPKKGNKDKFVRLACKNIITGKITSYDWFKAMENEVDNEKNLRETARKQNENPNRIVDYFVEVSNSQNNDEKKKILKPVDYRAP